MRYAAILKELTFSEIASIALVVIVPVMMLYALVF
jgi:hypothetical protein